ncbi:MAG: hypothetical protein NTAFB05_25940 [Nitrobacter sp.]|uniref:hypothetical protein n=1 Tax=Nitrobacter sp. TaxID=29420 RepID=UPI00387DEF62
MSKPNTTKPKRNSMQTTTAPAPANLVGPGGWVVSPPTSVLGGELLKQLKRAIRDYELLDEHKCFDRADIAISAGHEIANTLALVPPRGAEEALAAAAFLFSEAASFECVDEWSKKQREEMILRMKQRAAALAAWVESTHKVNRRDFRLDFFCPDDARDDVLPHTASSLDVNQKTVAVL